MFQSFPGILEHPEDPVNLEDPGIPGILVNLEVLDFPGILDYLDFPGILDYLDFPGILVHLEDPGIPVNLEVLEVL